MTDDGLKFFATVRRHMGPPWEVHRETDDRLTLLEWVAAHYHEGDDLTITIEARGPAALATARALAFGATQMKKP